ncbi:MAG: hypothetical protein JWM62_3319 [Frankiales bacterium]|nr:hypothetical protein [Frankiales bacterium]
MRSLDPRASNAGRVALTLLAAALLVACSGQGASPEPSGGATASAAAPDLSAIVLQPAEAPVGTTYLDQASGPRSLDKLLSGDQDAAQEKALLEEAGFEGAHLSVFTGGSTPAAVEQAHVVDSFAVVFPSAGAASAGLEVLSRLVAASATSSTSFAAPSLGERGRGYELTLPNLAGPSFAFTWQQENTARVLVEAGGAGVVTQELALSRAAELARAGPRGPVGADSVGALVLQPGAAPKGTALAPKLSGRRTAKEFAAAEADNRRLTELGFQSGYVNRFLSPGLLEATVSTPAPPETATPTRDGNYIASQAQQYATSEDATSAYTLFKGRQDKIFDGRAELLDSAFLGPNSVGYRYVDERPTGDLIGHAYFWQVDRYVLSLFDVGTARFSSEPKAQRLAKIMQSHLPG